MIAIGPLHHDDPGLQKAEKLKHKLAAYFIKKHGLDKEILYSKIKMEIGYLKKCYDPKEIEQYYDDDEKLSWIFILLENQIPYRVLDLLTSSSCNHGHGEQFEESIGRFIDGNVMSTPAEMKKRHKKDEYPHLLGHLRERLVVRNVKELRKAGRNLVRPATSWMLASVAYAVWGNYFDNDFAVTSYLCFLDSLIDEAEDVRALRDANILHNIGLGSDEEEQVVNSKKGS
ncbi:hypothetical protein COLO4_22407 [Corchorus olitorius]|uniref:Uncharacterized protein n=1 Tax=Corchorus olitorius TaxID=93759 RepID=A0A1R3IM09_9ROSI|nr:hypothetical protein COLO4_22407 [Corchorus olitorius]